MGIIKYVLNHKALFWVLMLTVTIGGIISYWQVGKLESPSYKIKVAVVATQYPGASAKDVEREVTAKIEEEIQKMSQIDNITSISRSGLSLIFVELKSEVFPKILQQAWDELRRKVNDIRPQLPSGVTGMRIRDDYGDVFGVFLALTGDGYSYDELKDQADTLKKELLRVDDVAKIDFWGVQNKAIYVEFERTRLAKIGIPIQSIFQTLNSSNEQVDAGAVRIGDEYSRFRVSGNIDKLDTIRNLYLTDSKGNLIRLGDIAEVKRGHIEPASQIMTFNGKPAIGIGISTVEGGNVIRMGEGIRDVLEKLQPSMPVGMEIGYINYQAEDVQTSIHNFMINLVESVCIVIGILLLTMGLRSGIVIGVTLLFTILGTFICMLAFSIDMQQVSLGSLIIALGMLVDNAIVIVDGYLIRTVQGKEPAVALSEVVSETFWPLLGATAVAIFAFGAVGLNDGNVGEFCKSLFSVLAISLILSWVLAITFTPLLCLTLIKPKKEDIKEEIFTGKIYDSYRQTLFFCLDRPKLTICTLFIALGIAGICFYFLPKDFFPDSARPKFRIDYWRNAASHIEETAKDVQTLADFVSKLPRVTNVTTFTGEGALRFILGYDYNSPAPEYGQIMVEVEDVKDIPELMQEIDVFAKTNFPSTDAMILRFSDTIDIPFKVAVRFMGPDHEVLRNLAAQAKEIFREVENIHYLRDDWNALVKSVKVDYSEIRGRQTGVSRRDVAQAIQWNFSGVTCGIFREGDTLIPIISRAAPENRSSIEEIDSTQVASSVSRQIHALGEVIDNVHVEWEPIMIRHRDRVPTITVQCSPIKGTAEAVRKQVKAKIEAIELPPLYSMAWAGEYEKSKKAQAKLKTLFPLFVLLMFLIIMMLFRTLREPLVAFSTLPFALIGVVIGLSIMGKPFGFLAILGFLGLSGMLLKNAIVLLDQINLELDRGTPRYQAVIKASVSRLRPVTMAAGTTVLGVVPLLFDIFFAAMSATIMFGLLFATLLSLLIVPVVYCILFKVKKEA